MAYVSLYRKYRPQTFAEVVGQTHVTTTLGHAIAADRLHHAYLFTGPRGTGKTSTARILAKSLNCEGGPTPTPCNACVHCTAITDGSSVDVIEIDAASHGGVDDVRDLRDRVAFAPASARRKVYIVDECHMLSTAGWNAFLKTVEEPPGHVVFVFATTEPHKVLDTILSRTQRFDFKRVAADVLADHLQSVGAREGLSFEPGVVDLVVRAGDGSVRDTLSVLDQVIAFGGRDVTLAGVSEVLGAVPRELLFETADLISVGDVAGVCVLVQRVADAGHDLRQFGREAVEHLRELFLVQVAPDARLVEATPERVERLRSQAARIGRVELLRAVELLGEAQAQMRRGNTRLPLEVALVKAALPEACGDAAALAARLDRLERRTGVDAAAETRPESRRPVRAVEVEMTNAVGQQDAEAVADVDPQAAEAVADVDIELVKRSWPAVLDAVRDETRRIHAVLSAGQPVAFEASELSLEFRHGFHAEQCATQQAQDVIGTAIERVLGIRPALRYRVAALDEQSTAVTNVDEEAEAVAETEQREAAGHVPDPDEAHSQAIETLTRDLGATVLDDHPR